ncbi:MAG: iron-sulfur cluster assembly accessory protein [Candidatus Aenigmarchaeota archaeon]|nr:iron-sulfur cluster assembly accessory protein [Candidatus Aenigmarchaeota archaeon]
MASYGLHCTGCHVNLFESLENGIRGHGLPEEQIAALVNAINEAIRKNGSLPVAQEEKPLSLTTAAVNKLRSVLEQQNRKDYGIRIQVIPGGCSGYMYSMDFEKKPANDDDTLDFSGVKIFVDKNSQKLLGGMKVDYVETLQGAGFKFDNPNAKASCGCGKSFH